MSNDNENTCGGNCYKMMCGNSSIEMYEVAGVWSNKRINIY